MSEGERRIADTKGRFAQVVKNGHRLDDADWTAGRILLSNKRLVLASGDGKRTIPLARIDSLDGRHDVNQSVAGLTEYTSLRCGEDVLLVAAAEHEAFETDLYTALLDREFVFARHPAVKGGVVQDTDWEKARVTVESEAVGVATEGGSFVEVDLGDVGSVEEATRTVDGESRAVVEVEHTVEGVSVQTYLSGSDRHRSFLSSLFRAGAEANAADLDLSEKDKEVLMALYSGVSPFEIPEFTGLEVDTVEETFEELVELDVLEEIRMRREVALTTRGRNVASEAINDR
jgi:helix-turn-helix protein